MSGVNVEKRNDTTTVFIFNNGSLKVTIKQGDLSKEVCDAIVNPTNLSMKPNGGLDTIIHDTMGSFFSAQVNAISAELGDNACPVGCSRIFISKTNRDPNVARFVINTVGPHYAKEGKDLASFHLQSCYGTSLALANSYCVTSIAYPAISCGAFRFPAREAAKVGIETIRQNSYQVTDVRFVLFELDTYRAFVDEWTNYADTINRDAYVIHDNEQNDVVSTSSDVVPKSLAFTTRISARFCELCKEKELSGNRDEICHECVSLPRVDVFNKLLHRLRLAAEKSFDDLKNECQILEPLLAYYPLNYVPAQLFDLNIHKRDPVAESYLQNYCDKKFRRAIPMAVLGDGNCFYNSFVKLASAGTTTEATTLTPVELRARNAIELILHKETYERMYSSCGPALDPFADYARKEMIHDTSYTSVWDVLSIPTILNIRVTSIYPRVNKNDDIYYTTINDKEFRPLNHNQTMALPEVRLLFSHTNKPLKAQDSAWIPNHFVPVLNLR